MDPNFASGRMGPGEMQFTLTGQNLIGGCRRNTTIGTLHLEHSLW